MSEKCKYCGEQLCSGDYGWYCPNPDCDDFDLDILAYECPRCGQMKDLKHEMNNGDYICQDCYEREIEGINIYMEV